MIYWNLQRIGRQSIGIHVQRGYLQGGTRLATVPWSTVRDGDHSLSSLVPTLRFSTVEVIVLRTSPVGFVVKRDTRQRSALIEKRMPEIQMRKVHRLETVEKRNTRRPGGSSRQKRTNPMKRIMTGRNGFGVGNVESGILRTILMRHSDGPKRVLRTFGLLRCNIQCICGTILLWRSQG